MDSSGNKSSGKIKMTTKEIERLDQLVIIRDEEDTPMGDFECGLVTSLDQYGRHDGMSPKQAAKFDEICNRHLGDGR